ncbi:MAG: hypothetical protein QM820_10035 [Minicystis sp.]
MRTLFRPSSAARAAGLVTPARHGYEHIPSSRPPLTPRGAPLTPVPGSYPAGEPPMIDLELPWSRPPSRLPVAGPSSRPAGRDGAPSSLPPRGVPLTPVPGSYPAPAGEPPMIDLEVPWSRPPSRGPLAGPSSRPGLEGVPSSRPPHTPRGAPSTPAPASGVRLEAPVFAAAPELPEIDLDWPSSVDIPISAPTPQSHDSRAIEATYVDALGGPIGVPRLAVSPAQLTSLPLGREAGFLLSRVDGESTVDDLCDISSLGRLDTLRILFDLLQQGVITVRR